ncbi:MAG: indole-3-glycerol phosphate synthase TrpC [Coriobacteriia bacterium]|nr:indole-3-glycerol phosphate synthase TrpC [Coriobacteriia bacterium]
MATILDTIAEATRVRVAQAAAETPLEELQAQCAALGAGEGVRFLEALQRPQFSFICEVKKASPSKGLIAPDFPYVSIAQDYEAAGADCISCLTEPQWFMGSDAIFGEIRTAVATPMIRKDFTVDVYQIYQARTMNANAVLLICSLLDTPTLAQYLDLAHSLGLVALVETHDGAEISQAVEVGARIIGVNNRNLKDFSVDFSNAQRLRELIPPHCVYVAESGVACAEDVATMAAMGADAALIGEALMRAEDKGAKLAEFRAAAQGAQAARSAQ